MTEAKKQIPLGPGAPTWDRPADFGLPESSAPIFDIGQTIINDKIKQNFQRSIPIFGKHWASLKYYFEVDNKYVLHKLRTIVFSALLRGKKWKREFLETASDTPDQPFTKKFSSAMFDENAPDLYLPLMSFVTYVVVSAYIKGTNGNFTPEVLGQVMYHCLGFQVFEVILIRLGLFLLNEKAPVLDLTANTGYKYIGLCINMLVGMLLGRWMYFGSLIWTGCMTSYFMLKTLANNYASSNETKGNPMRMPLLYSCAVLQFVSIWWLGYGREFLTSGNS